MDGDADTSFTFAGLLQSPRFKLHPAALYTVLFLVLGLRIYCACWIPFFRHETVPTSAFKVIFLQLLFVVQAVCIGAFINDMIFQHAQEQTTFPKLPILFIIFIGFFCEIVFALTKAFRPTMEHAIFSHFIPFLISVLLHISYMRPEPFSRGWEVLSLYAASVVAVFWNDIRDNVLWTDGTCSLARKDPATVQGDNVHVLIGGGSDSVLAFVRSLEGYEDLLASASDHLVCAAASSSTQTDASKTSAPTDFASSGAEISPSGSETGSIVREPPRLIKRRSARLRNKSQKKKPKRRTATRK